VDCPAASRLFGGFQIISLNSALGKALWSSVGMEKEKELKAKERVAPMAGSDSEVVGRWMPPKN
jgi:hypothetical protein